MADTTQKATYPAMASTALSTAAAAVTNVWSFAWAVVSSPKALVTVLALIAAWTAGHFDIGARLIGRVSKDSLATIAATSQDAADSAGKAQARAEAEALELRASLSRAKAIERLAPNIESPVVAAATPPAPVKAALAVPKRKPAPPPAPKCDGFLSCAAAGIL